MDSKYLVDTSSLLSLVRYYLYFDNNTILYNKIQGAFRVEQCIFLENVRREAELTAKGIILKELDFLKTVTVKKNIYPVPTQKLDRIIDNNWCRGSQRNKISAGEYSIRKQEEIEKKADFQLIFKAMEMERDKNLTNDNPIIVTEETGTENDSKLFKKIPTIADSRGIQCITLPEMLKQIGVQIQYI